MRRIAVGLGLAAAVATSSSSENLSSVPVLASLRTHREAQHDADTDPNATIDLPRQRPVTATIDRRIVDTVMGDAISQKEITSKNKKRKARMTLTHRNNKGLGESDAISVEDDGYWDRFLTTETSTLEPTKSPTPFPTSPPTPNPTSSSLNPTAKPTTAAPSTPAPTFVCNVSPEERSAQITAEALAISDVIDFVAPFSPQSRALKWIIEDDALYICPDDADLSQRYVMAVFYFSTDGPNWTQCSAPANLSDPASVAEANNNCNLEVEIGQGGTDAWLTPVDECNWGGVACDIVEGTMERIEFEKNGLGGTIPRELQELTELRFLHMEEGNTGGTLPSELGNLKNLLELDMNFNSLEGSIPANMYNLANLLEFDMNDNSLSGPISSDIQKMGKLTFLQLHRNQMTGTIPVEVGNLERLIVATFDTNFFQQPMPEEVCLLRAGNLRTLTSDCLDPEDPFYVECPTPCCTQCF